MDHAHLKGIMRLIKHHQIQVEGKNAVVGGRSPILGKPMAMMLLNENATETHLSLKNTRSRVNC
ncbi:MAG: hypothetical protein Ct9H90mP4_06480 [Gammaproteobacteria bacterium]|nr:MAG: hypothetical protein Ct9H90mP4_06480 [Gammaproteobacteria bacterium]